MPIHQKQASSLSNTNSKLTCKSRKRKPSNVSSERFGERQILLEPLDSKIKTLRDSEGNISSGSSELLLVAQSQVYTIPQEHGRTKAKLYAQALISPSQSIIDVTGSISLTSITSSITRLRSDFDEFKCKMEIFGESLNLCKCIASDFKNMMKWIEKRLDNLEKRHKLTKTESNYSAIINKNKKLSQKCLRYAKNRSISWAHRVARKKLELN